MESETMMTISKEVASRIDQATGAIGLATDELVSVLHARFGAPVTQDKLERVTLTDLQSGVQQLLDSGSAKRPPAAESLAQAVQILWGTSP